MESKNNSLLLQNSLSARVIVYSLLVTVLVTSLMAFPLVAHYSDNWLKNRVAAAYLISLATESSSEGSVNRNLEQRLLTQANVLGITIRKADNQTFMLGPDMPLVFDYHHDLRYSTMQSTLSLLLKATMGGGQKIIHITDNAPGAVRALVEIDIGCHELFLQAMDSTKRALGTALLTALLMSIFFYGFLQISVVLPLQHLTSGILAFRADPNDVSRTNLVSGRIDEIGIAEEAFQQMQNDIRATLVLRTRLAAIGMAVTKIQHDLKGLLSSVMVVSDTLETSRDPEVRRIFPGLITAIDRAVELCHSSLNFATEGPLRLELEKFNLFTFIEELFKECNSGRKVALINQVPPALVMVGDKAQLRRVIGNLILNALEADSSKIIVSAVIRQDRVEIDITDNGTGIPEKLKSQIFKPFISSTKAGNSGLGLSIAKDVVSAHGGTISIVVSEPGRTVFSVHLPIPADY
ncbi:sensor histidine kinase [Sedimenticola thiotaurini]|uniref:histidine kinase n=1 Tax=Sedimenticola thiotaurini TaxID=1543721 RepID=A0A0F7K091_9GAMM|nr:HAMP domain-containing sensor histidine kinase [Sedimenticola thiotaurini]AKH20373.1 hypothetical protein AAY24_08425 [Sedimenticola thiotaurini]